MSDILIKGMEMPKDKPICIIIDSAGQVRHYDLNNDKYADDELFEAVSVPPHGRLIDADASLYNLGRIVLPDDLAYTIGHDMAKRFFEKAPTIIPAEDDET